MGLLIYPEFEKELTEPESDATGEWLAVNFEVLDNIAAEANLTPFTAFADSRQIPDDFDGGPDELAELMGEWSEWFDASQGQAAMQALAERIQTNPYVAGHERGRGRLHGYAGDGTGAQDGCRLRRAVPAPNELRQA